MHRLRTGKFGSRRFAVAVAAVVAASVVVAPVGAEPTQEQDATAAGVVPETTTSTVASGGDLGTDGDAVTSTSTIADGLQRDAAVEPAPGSVVINEIHYHPEVDGQEFLELHNPTGTSADLGGACFTAGIGGCFAAGTTLDAGGFVVVAESLADYTGANPGAPAPKLIYTGSLSNSGETVTITSASSVALDSVTYADKAPWPSSPDGDGPSLELVDPLADNQLPARWRPSDPAPTPGAINTQFGMGATPVIDHVEPGTVVANAAIPFTATIADADVASIEVTVGFAAPVTVPLHDDGAHGDGAAGDGIYGASIAGRPAGTLVRYRAVATNGTGTTSLPMAGSARPRFGFIVARPPVASNVPVIDWFLDPKDDAKLKKDPYASKYYVPAVIAFGDEVWDGVEVRISGNTRSPVKYSYKFKMPKGSPLVVPFLEHPVDEFVFDGDLNDASGVVNPLARSVYADTNPLMSQMTKVRVQQNGAHFGLFTLTEERDKLWRKRNGLEDPGDEQYEPEDITGVFVDDGSAAKLAPRFEKVEPEDGDYRHLYELVRAIDSAPTPARMAELRDLLDIPALVDVLAAGAIVQHWDMTVHNYELLRDGKTGRWRIVANDFDNTMVGGVAGLFPYGPDHLVSALRSDPVFADMYLRRVRTMADRYFTGGVLKQRLNAMTSEVAAEQAADVARWPRVIQTPAQGKAKIQGYLDTRKKELLETHRTDAEVPAAPTAGLPISIASARYAGPGGAARDAVTLRNPAATEAIDVSGWQLTGAGTSTIPPGTVIPAGTEITIPTDELASAADRAPGSFVAGSLSPAGLDDAGGLLEVRDASGAVRGQAVLADLSVPPASAAAGLVVEASADQVETLSVDGSGIGLTVAVANHGPAAATSVKLTGAGTNCGRSLGTIARGASVTVRCATVANGTYRDRSYRFRATSGSTSYASARVEVRTLIHHTNYWSQTLPNAPTAGPVTTGQGATVKVPVTLAPPTSRTTPNAPPVRWIVATAFESGRGIATQGTVLRPASNVSMKLAEGVPVRVSVAARNGAGTGARTVPTPYLTPRSSSLWPFASAAAATDWIFRTIDRRTPTAQERSWALALLQGGQSPATVMEWRLANGRWPTEVEPLIRLYAAYLGRIPETAGLRYWVAQRAKGRTLTSISSVFAASSEFQRNTGSLDDAAFVRFVYRSVLGRQADAAGLSYWTRQLRSGWTRGRVMTTFSESSEGRTKLRPMVGPTLAGFAMLGSSPSTGRAQPASEWLAAGGSLRTVIDGIRTSSEFGHLVG